LLICGAEKLQHVDEIPAKYVHSKAEIAVAEVDGLQTSLPGEFEEYRLTVRFDSLPAWPVACCWHAHL
jgi:hypothetical protein